MYTLSLNPFILPMNDFIILFSEMENAKSYFLKYT